MAAASSAVMIVLPGDRVEADTITVLAGSHEETPIKVGRGLEVRNASVRVTTAGKLNFRAPNTFWVESSGKRYNRPRQGDNVVAVVEDRAGDYYTVNINSGNHCILNRIAFDGATKRNKPELKRGDLVYGRVIAANGDADVEISCTSTSGPKKDWSTGETIYGPLMNGLLISVSIGHARSLLRPDCAVLHALGR